MKFNWSNTIFYKSLLSNLSYKGIYWDWWISREFLTILFCKYSKSWTYLSSEPSSLWEIPQILNAFLINSVFSFLIPCQLLSIHEIISATLINNNNNHSQRDFWDTYFRTKLIFWISVARTKNQKKSFKVGQMFKAFFESFGQNFGRTMKDLKFCPTLQDFYGTSSPLKHSQDSSHWAEDCHWWLYKLLHLQLKAKQQEMHTKGEASYYWCCWNKRIIIYNLEFGELVYKAREVQKWEVDPCFDPNKVFPETKEKLNL